MSMVSGELAIGSKGLAMALSTRQGETLQLTMEANVREHYLRGKLGYTADNLYFRVKQPVTLSFFLSHATAYKEDYNYVHILALPINSILQIPCDQATEVESTTRPSTSFVHRVRPRQSPHSPASRNCATLGDI